MACAAPVISHRRCEGPKAEIEDEKAWTMQQAYGKNEQGSLLHGTNSKPLPCCAIDAGDIFLSPPQSVPTAPRHVILDAADICTHHSTPGGSQM